MADQTEKQSVVGEPASSTGMGSAEGAGQFEAWLAEVGAADTLAGPWPRTIADVEKALEWAGEAEQEIAEVQARLDAHLAAVRARALAMTEQPNRRYTALMARVESWAQTHRGEVVRGKSKSRQLLTGSVAFRASPEKVVVQDEAAFLAWAQPDHLDLLRFPEPEIDKRKLAAFVTSTGEIPPGVDVQPAAENITVKTTPLPMLGASSTKPLKE